MNQTTRKPITFTPMDIAFALLQGTCLSLIILLCFLLFSAVAIDHGNLTQDHTMGIILSSVVLSTLVGGMFSASVVKKHSLIIGMAVGFLVFLTLLLLGYLIYPSAHIGNNGLEILFASLVGGGMAKIFSQKKRKKY